MALGGTYNTGLALLANGSLTVSGYGVLWNDVIQGDFIQIGTAVALVNAVDITNTIITLMDPWPGASSPVITVTVATPGVITLNNHGFLAGQQVAFLTTGALPTGLVAGVIYYVIASGLTTNTFEVSATLGGSAINTSGSQSGVHSLAQSYRILKMSWQRYDPSLTQQKLREFITNIEAAGIFLYVSGAAPDPALGENGQYALKTNVYPWQLWLNVAGTWVLQSSESTGFNFNGGALPTPQVGAILQMSNVAGTISRLENDSYAASAHFTAMRADGTVALPTALVANDEIGSFNAGGYNGAAWVEPRAAFRVFAHQNWTTGAQGTYADITATPDGATAAISVAQFYGSGLVNIGGALTVGAAFTYGGVTLNNAVTGTGNMVLATAPSVSSLTVTTAFTATGLVTNTDLVNSTISGIALGSNLAALTFGTHLASGGSSYNGSTVVTITSDATSANTASTIVARDGSGNFSAGTITASLTGHASLDLPLASGGTLGGELVTVAPTTAGAGLNLPPGTAPTSPVNGDLWTTSGGLFARIAGTTVGPYIVSQTTTLSGDATGSGSTSITVTLATVNSNTGGFGGANAVPEITVNAKGLITAVSTVTLNPTQVNGVSFPVGGSTNTVPVLTGSNTITYESVPNAALANSSITLGTTVMALGTSNTTIAGAITWTGLQTVNGAALTLSGNISQAAWTTAGVRFAGVAASYTDTSSSGTVAAAYTDLFPASTILASSATTYTNYFGVYFKDPVASTHVTMTSKWSLGADSIFGTKINATSFSVANNNSYYMQNSSGANDGALKEGSGGSVFFLMGAANVFYVTDNGQNPILNVQGSGVGGIVLVVVGASTLAGTSVQVTSTQASTAYTNGALQVTGGVGVGGALYANGSIVTNGGLNVNSNIVCTGAITCYSTAGIGYGTGLGIGGVVTQATNKSTGVTLSKASGQITMNNAALAAATIVSFTLTNTAIAATDLLILNHVSGGTPGSYTLDAQCASGSATINIRNNTAGSLSEAIVIAFALIKGATS